MRDTARQALVVITVLLALAALVGWWFAIARAGQLETARSSLDAAQGRAQGLQQQTTSLQQQLTTAEAARDSAKREASEAQRALDEARRSNTGSAELEKRLAAANARADAAETSLKQAREESRAKSESPHADARRSPSDDLPLPGLPSGSSPRDYLVAAQQAIKSGRVDLARAALGRAEVRTLNAAHSGAPPTPEEHRRIAAIDHAIALLKRNERSAALKAVDGILSGTRR